MAHVGYHLSTIKRSVAHCKSSAKLRRLGVFEECNRFAVKAFDKENWLGVNQTVHKAK